MKTLAWLIVIGALAGIGYYLWRMRRGWLERQRNAEQRLTEMMVSARPPSAAVPATPASVAPAPTPSVDSTGLATQKLLFDAAGEAGEPALSIQLYARLLSRYPDSAFATQVRAAVEVQKKKLTSV